MREKKQTWCGFFMQLISIFSTHLLDRFLLCACVHTLLHWIRKLMYYNFALLICRRPDITEGLKGLNCRTLIFVGDSSPFHSEAIHMTSKIDRKFSALVEVCSTQCRYICNLVIWLVMMNIWKKIGYDVCRSRLADRWWQRNNRTQCWYLWSTFWWGMVYIGHASSAAAQEALLAHHASLPSFFLRKAWD